MRNIQIPPNRFQNLSNGPRKSASPWDKMFMYVSFCHKRYCHQRGSWLTQATFVMLLGISPSPQKKPPNKCLSLPYTSLLQPGLRVSVGLADWSLYFLWHDSAWFSTVNVTSAGSACIICNSDKRDIMQCPLLCLPEQREAQHERLAYSSAL